MRHGKEQVAEVFAILDRDFDIREFAPLRFFTEGDDVAVLMTLRTTGRHRKEVHQDLVHVWTLGIGGLATRMRDSQDSAGVAAAFGGEGRGAQVARSDAAYSWATAVRSLSACLVIAAVRVLQLGDEWP